jgi:hypothetical protein
LESIGLDHLEAARRGVGQLRECGDATRVALDRDHAARAGGKERAGEPARPWADLEHRAAAQVAGRARDLGQELRVEQEVLAKPFVRPQPKPFDNRAQRRQIGKSPAQRRTSTNASLRRSRR